ncbi:MFS transporter [Micromonospora sp. NPDC023737]|uniref:MFS transporter n=1 Tax=unclassified Micromonospora TaxID=2617518 RepID=UPI0033CC9F2B
MLLAGQLMANIDVSVVNVATPSISAELGASGAMLEAVIAGYTLVYAVLLVTGARAGQLFGYRRVFLSGLSVFGLASLLCGLAPSPAVLVGARLLQGLGAAALVPQVLTGIQHHFTGPRRAKAVSAYGAVLAGSAVVGQILGGVLTSANLFGTGWRPIFLINVPIGLISLLVGRRVLPAPAPAVTRPDLDTRGTVTLTAGLTLVVVPLLFGRESGWPAWTWASLVAGLAALALFGRLQQRTTRSGGSPVLRVELMQRRSVGAGLVALAGASGTYFALLFTLAQYLQGGLGHGPIYSGLVLLPWVTAFGLAGRALPHRGRISLPTAAGVGCLLLAAAYAALAVTVYGDRPSLPVLLVVLAGGGFGLGLNFAALMATITGSVHKDEASDASGLITTASQLGGVIVVAGLGTLYYGVAGSHPAGHAYAAVNAVSAAVAIVAAIASISTRPQRRTSD